MKTQFKNTISTKFSGDNRLLLSNFASLTLLQGTNFILPLLVLPYLIRTLGVENFGLVTFAQAVVGYLTTLADYGFNLSATRSIAICKHDIQRVSGIFSDVFSTKILLGVFCFILLLTLTCTFPQFKSNKSLYFLSFSIVVGQISLPIWFFQGMEKMKFITYSSIITKILFTCFIVLFIKYPSDYIYVNMYLGFGNIISGIISLIIIRKYFHIHFYFSSFQRIKQQLKETWHIFISSLTINLSINSNLLVLGIVSNPTAVGYYSIAEKIFFALRAIVSVVYQAVYPRVCVLANASFHQLLSFLRQIIIGIIVVFLPASFLLFILAEYIIYYLSGTIHYESIVILKILCWSPLIAALNIPACQTMLAYDLKKSYATISTMGAVFNLILNLILSSLYAGIGTSIASLCTETFITICLYGYLKLFEPKYTILRIMNPFVKIK